MADGVARRGACSSISAAKKMRRNAERLGQGVDRRLVGFEIKRDDAGDGIGRQTCLLQRAAREGDQFLRVGAALAPHAEGQDRRMDHKRAAFFRNRGGDADRAGDAPAPRHRLAQTVDPGRSETVIDFDSDIFAGQQRGGDRLGGGGTDDTPAFRRFVDGDAEHGVAGGGDRGFGVQGGGDARRKPVGAAMAAQDRHHRAAIGGHGDDWRFVGLVLDQRRECPHENARGAHADDGRAGAEQRAQMDGGVGEDDVGLGDAAGAAMKLAAP